MEVPAERFLIIGRGDVRVDSAAEYVAIHCDQIHRPRMPPDREEQEKTQSLNAIDLMVSDFGKGPFALVAEGREV